MSAELSNPVVPSSHNPSIAVHPAASGQSPPGGNEVSGPVPESPGPGPGAPDPSPPDPGVVAGASTFREGFLALLTVFAQFLRTPPKDFSRRGGPNARQVSVTALLVTLLRDYPTLATYGPEAIVTTAANADAMDMVAALLQSLLARVQDTSRMLRADVWFQLHPVYVMAQHRARTDPSLADRLAPVKAALAQGKRTDTSAKAVADASHAAAKAQTRAVKAQQRAVAATQTHARITQAHAANQRVRGGNTTPVANPQGPSASADVNPQGPSR